MVLNVKILILSVNKIGLLKCRILHKSLCASTIKLFQENLEILSILRTMATWSIWRRTNLKLIEIQSIFNRNEVSILDLVFRRRSMTVDMWVVKSMIRFGWVLAKTPRVRLANKIPHLYNNECKTHQKASTTKESIV